MTRDARVGTRLHRMFAFAAIVATAVTAVVAAPPDEAAAAPAAVLFDDVVQLDSPVFDAWRSLEAEARETVAATRGVPNDSRLAWFARDEIRAVMFARLVSVIEIQASGGTLSPTESRWVTAATDLVRTRRIAAARSALDEYDRWAGDPCAYQPPGGFGFQAFAPCGTGLGGLFNPLSPSADQFTAYGTALNLDPVLLDPDTRVREEAVVQALVVFGGLSIALVGAVTGALLVASGFSVAASAGSLLALSAAIPLATASISTGFLVAGVGIALAAAIVTAVGIWQLVVSEQVRPTLLQRLTAARSQPIDPVALTSQSGIGELYSLFLGQTLPDRAAERAAASTPTPSDPANDPQFLDVDTASPVPSIRTLDWDGRPQTTYISGRWFVTRSDGGEFEWDATLQFRGGDGVNASAVLGPNGFASGQRTSDGSFVARNSNQLWVSDPDVLGATHSYTFSGNTAPRITAVRQSGNPTRPDFRTLFEGDRLVFGVTASDAEDGDVLTTTWYLPPDGGGAFAEACTPADGSLDPLFRCQWDVRDGARAEPTYTESGSYLGRVRVTDSRGAFDERWFAFTVVNVDPTLVVDQTSTITVDEGTPVTFSGTSSDPGADQLRITVDWGDGTVQSQSYPCAGPVAADGTCTAAIIGAASDPTSWSRTRTYARPGTYTVTITADDFQGGSTSTTRQVVVPTYTVNVDQPFATTTGSRVDLYANVRSFGDVPYRITVDWGDGTFTTADSPCTGSACAFGQSPPGGIISLCLALGQRCTWFGANHTYAEPGEYTITVTPSRPAVDLTFAAGSTRVTIARPANRAPIVVDDVINTTEDVGTIAFAATGLLSNDSDPDQDPIQVTAVTQPTNGTVTVGDAGNYSFTPNANANGSSTFSYTVSDGTATTTGTVRVNITPVNDPPSFTAGAAPQVTSRAAVTVPGWATAISPGPADESAQGVTFEVVPDDATLFTSDGQPAVSSDGTLTFRPARSGTTSLSVVAVDDGSAVGNANRSAAQRVTISVPALADLSLTSSTSGALLPGAAGEVRLVLANAGPDATSSTVRVEVPAGLELVTPAPAAYDPATSRWTVGAVPAGAQATLVLGVRMRDSGATTVGAEVLSATVTDPDSTPDNGVGNVEDDRTSVTVTRAVSRFALVYSTSNLRTSPVPLDGATVSGRIAAFVPGDREVARVEFFLDDPTMSRAPRRVDRGAPFDVVGTGTTRATMFSTRTLTDGRHTITARVVLRNGSTEVVTAAFTVSNPRPATRQLMVSTRSDRSGAVALAGGTISGPVAVFVPNEDDIDSIEFRLDGRRVRTEGSRPWDYGRTRSDGRATLVRFAAGIHTVTARIEFTDGSTDTVEATFTAT